VTPKLLKINDPIHDFIIFPDFISKIVDSQEIQRLTRVRQLAGANYVFPGANHTRFEHSLGVAALAQRLMNNLVNIHNVALTKDDINDCIVAGLCHDIGHGPFSHNFESIYLKYLKKDHEDFTHWLITNSELGDILTDLGFDKLYIANLATGRSSNANFPKGLLIGQIISSAFNVDSMDYLLRDNYHCGTKGNSIDLDRLLLGIDEIEDGILGIDIRALFSLEGFLLARINSFRTIYFHKTCRAVQLMTTAAIEQILDESNIINYKTPDDFIYWDDYMLWAELVHNPKSTPYMEKIKRRQLLKLCYESKSSLEQMEINSDEIKDELNKITGIPLKDIFFDSPSSPNVPYSHMAETRQSEIYTFEREGNTKKSVNLDDYTIFSNQFKGHLNLFRIYTWPQYRKTLTDASIKIFKAYSK
jgi:HD superfamily phosphohydrolase